MWPLGLGGGENLEGGWLSRLTRQQILVSRISFSQRASWPNCTVFMCVRLFVPLMLGTISTSTVDLSMTKFFLTDKKPEYYWTTHLTGGMVEDGQANLMVLG